MIVSRGVDCRPAFAAPLSLSRFRRPAFCLLLLSADPCPLEQATPRLTSLRAQTSELESETTETIRYQKWTRPRDNRPHGPFVHAFRFRHYVTCPSKIVPISMRDLAKSQSRLRMSGPPHQPRARASGPRCRRCLPRPPAPAATAGRPVGSARRLHPRDVAVAERFLDRYVFQCTHPPRPSNLRCAAQLLPSETPPPAQGRHHQTLPHGRAASSVCRSARPGPLAAASIGRGTRI